MHIEGKWKDWTARGSIAFVALQVERETQKVEKVLFGRNNNPLNLYIVKSKKTITNVVVSSEGPGEEIEADMLYSLDLVSMKLKVVKFKIGGTYEYSKVWKRELYDNDYDPYAYNGYSSHNKKLLQPTNKNNTDTKIEGFGKEIVITKDEPEPTSEELEKIEEIEEAIADELGEYINDRKAFKINDILEELVDSLSSFEREKLYSRNKIMSKFAKIIIDAEKYAESLHDNLKDIDWELPIAEADIEESDEFDIKEEENSKIENITVH
jgi:hypothetical protein